MQDIALAFMVPAILFLAIVAPIWLVLHYRSKRQQAVGLSEAEQRELRDLGDTADRMADRITTLESILDVEAPGWRERAGRS